MEIDDIIRKAKYRAEKLALRLDHTYRSSLQEQYESLIESALEEFWDQVHRISHKRESYRSMERDFLKKICDELTKLGVHYFINDVDWVSLSKIGFTIRPYEDGNDVIVGVLSSYGWNRILPLSVSPSDMAKYLVALDKYKSYLEYRVDALLSESIKINKTNELMLLSAEHLIGKKLKDLGVKYTLRIDSRGRILCIMSHSDNLAYHKSCRANIENLVEQVNKTVSILTAYRFTGYIEDV